MQEFRTKHSQIQENIRKKLRWKRKIDLNIRKKILMQGWATQQSLPLQRDEVSNNLSNLFR